MRSGPAGALAHCIRSGPLPCERSLVSEQRRSGPVTLGGGMVVFAPEPSSRPVCLQRWRLLCEVANIQLQGTFSNVLHVTSHSRFEGLVSLRLVWSPLPESPAAHQHSTAALVAVS